MAETGHIFLSYRTLDADFALKLAADLKNAGVKLWMDRLDGISVGMDWRDTIENAINTCAAMIAILSPDYVTSEYCRKELARANRLKRPIFPILLRLVKDEEMPFALEGIHYEDFTIWLDEKNYQERFDKLLKRLKDEFSGGIGNAPDAETRYLTSLIAELESRRGVLEYVELYGETDVYDARPKPLPDDEWGFSLLIEQPQSRGTNKISLRSIGEALEKHSRFVLIGEPGAGKTTTIRRLARDVAQKRLDNPRINPLPLLLYLPQWNDDIAASDFVCTRYPIPGDCIGLLHTGEILLFLDGLNEMGADGWKKVKLLSDWFNSPIAPTKVIITCRAEDYTGDLKLPDFPIVFLQELTFEQVSLFVSKYGSVQAGKILEQINPPKDQEGSPWVSMYRGQYQHRSLYELVRNPYMLSALLYIYEHSRSDLLPSNPGFLFQRLIKALWKREEQRGTTGELLYEEAVNRCANLAFAMIKERKPTNVPLNYALEYLGDTNSINVFARANFVWHNSEYVRFYHQLLQEFFAAVKIDQETLYHILPEPSYEYEGRIPGEWDNVFIALSAIVSDVDDLLLMMIEKDPILAARCISNGARVSSPTYQTVVSYLHTILGDGAEDISLSSTYFTKRFSAAVALGELKSEESVPHLVKSVQGEPYSSAVRETAAWALGEIASSEAVGALDEALYDMYSHVQVAAALALEKIGSLEAVVALVGRLFANDSDYDLEGHSPKRFKAPPFEGTRISRVQLADILMGIGSPEALAAVEKWRLEQHQ